MSDVSMIYNDHADKCVLVLSYRRGACDGTLCVWIPHSKHDWRLVLWSRPRHHTLWYHVHVCARRISSQVSVCLAARNRRPSHEPSALLDTEPKKEIHALNTDVCTHAYVQCFNVHYMRVHTGTSKPALLHGCHSRTF